MLSPCCMQGTVQGAGTFLAPNESSDLRPKPGWVVDRRGQGEGEWGDLFVQEGRDILPGGDISTRSRVGIC